MGEIRTTGGQGLLRAFQKSAGAIHLDWCFKTRVQISAKLSAAGCSYA